MKFKLGDLVLVTGGKDKGQRSKIVKVFPKLERVVVEGVNMYTKHIKPTGDRPGEKVKRERPLPLAKIAIINEKGQADRIGYRVTKSGKKERIFKKTGTAIDATAVKSAQSAVKKSEPKTKKEVKKSK